MPALKSLSFAPVPQLKADPVTIRRAKLVARLHDQQKLLTDPAHVRTTQRWADVDGERKLTTKSQRVTPWWGTDGSGRTFLVVKYGNRLVEFEKGKAAIALASKDELPKTLETLIAAVQAGELDEILARATTKVASKGKRQA